MNKVREKRLGKKNRLAEDNFYEIKEEIIEIPTECAEDNLFSLESPLEKKLNEKRTEDESILSIYCNDCKIITAVIHSSKIHNTGNNNNVKANCITIIGAIYSGLGCIPLNNSLEYMKVPTISFDVYQKYEKEVDISLLQIMKLIMKNEKKN